MKKLTLIVCAGLVALAAVSCKKDVKPAAPMSPDEAEQKLVQVAVNAINEVDPKYWGDWFTTCYDLEKELASLESDKGLKELVDDLRALFVTESGTETAKVVTAVIRLSQVTGDLTIENKTVKYTKSSNPLNITMTCNGKAYKAQLEAKGESSTPLEVYTYESEYESETISVCVPQTAAVHVTENGSLFADLVVNPVVTDTNKNNKLDESDTIGGSLVLQIPAYKLAVSNMSVSENGISGVITFSHGSTTILSLDGKVEFEYRGVKSLIPSGFEMDDITINSLSVMDGQAILKGGVDWEDIITILGNESYASQTEAQTASRALNNSVKAELYFDNNPTCQAWFTTVVKASNEDGSYYVIPAVNYADGTVKSIYEYDFEDEVWDPVKVAVTNFSKKVNDLLPKNQANQVQ